MSEQIRWGLIGTGDIARKRIAPALRDLPAARLVAVCRRQANLAESFAREFGAPRWYATVPELFADADVDAVYIATPVHLHAAQTIAGANAGKHVLCEKPMALNVAECDEMIAACRANNVALGVAYYRRFYPAIVRIREIMASGEIGTVVMAQINVFEAFNPTGDNPRSWLLNKAQAGGGPMLDYGCHRLEMLVNMFGPVSQVSSAVGNVVHRREVEDTAIALLTFELGGYATLSVTHAASEAQDTLDIYGSAGSIHVAALNEGSVRVTAGSNERMELLPPHTNLHAPLIEEFMEAVRSHRAPAVDGEAGRAVTAIEDQIYASTPGSNRFAGTGLGR
ncbi:MAG: hypothetical protein JWM95_3928 [Gemmatimonadetes bacterium]|nr:hypothetical protein [Gemmatimonadota bacterium]